MSKGFLVRAKITHNLDIARSGKFPVYGYGYRADGYVAEYGVDDGIA